MPIDWFTVLAQAINFLVLIWLLKRFLYRPVLAAIDAREQAVAAALAEADAARAQARSERDDFHALSAELEQQRAALMQQAAGQAEAEGRRLLEQARRQADAARAAQQAALLADARHNADALALRARREVFAIARKVLADLAGAGLEEGAVAAFLRQLADLPAAQRDTLAAALRDATTPARLRSAFALPPPQRDAIAAALRQLSGVDVALQYETAPQLLAGIELTAGGQRLDWNIDSYLASWQDSLLAAPVAAQPAGGAQQDDAQPAAPRPAETIAQGPATRPSSAPEWPAQAPQLSAERQAAPPSSPPAPEAPPSPVPPQPATSGASHVL